jgi:hypothetical protein
MHIETEAIGKRFRRWILEIGVVGFLCMIGWDYYQGSPLTVTSILRAALAAVMYTVCGSLLEQLLMNTVRGTVNKHGDNAKTRGNRDEKN